MQKLINKYFNEICKSKFFKNDDEVILGKAKDVIDNLNEQYNYVKNPDNNIDEDESEFITSEIIELIKKIKKKYSDEDVIKLETSHMLGFYMLADEEKVLEELKEYYNEERKED